MRMKNVAYPILSIFYFCLASCASMKMDFYHISYDVGSVVLNTISDTTPATIPDDYFVFCNCTQGVYDLAPRYQFRDLYRKDFSRTEPARYMLCSVVSIDSIRRFERDSMLNVLHITVASHGIYFSPYFLDYWLPDRLDTSEVESAYSMILDKIVLEENQMSEIRNLGVLVLPREKDLLRNGMKNKNTNLFLLRLNGDEDCALALQFFSKGEYDVSVLYTRLQYYKYLAKRLKGFLPKKE